MALVIAPTNSMHFRRSKDDDGECQLINVFLKMWDGKTLCCVIDPTQAAIVDVLEQKVMQSYPTFSKNNFYFEMAGKPLLDASTSNFQNNATVFCQYRNRGGCFMVSFSIMITIFALILGSTCTCGTSLLMVPLLLPFLFVLPLFCL